MILTRRNFFGLVAAPAVIRVADLMPVRAVGVIAPAFGLSVAESQRFTQTWMNFWSREMLRHAQPLLVLDRLTPQSAVSSALKRDQGSLITFRRPSVFT